MVGALVANNILSTIELSSSWWMAHLLLLLHQNFHLVLWRQLLLRKRCEALIRLMALEVHMRWVARHVVMKIMCGREILASLATFLAAIRVNDVALTAREGGGRGILLRRLLLHVVEGALVLSYGRVIGSLAGSTCSFYYDIVCDRFSIHHIHMVILILVGTDEVMHILRHGAFRRSGVTAAQARTLRPAKHSIRLAAAFRFRGVRQTIDVTLR